MTPAELLRCVIAARTIQTEIDQVHTCLLLSDLSPTAYYTINLSLEIIDKHMATLTDLMATETAAPAPTIPCKEAQIPGNTPTPPATHTCDQCHFALPDYYAKARNRPDILYTSYKCELTGRRINAKLTACLLYRARHPSPTPHPTGPPTPP